MEYAGILARLAHTAHRFLMRAQLPPAQQVSEPLILLLKSEGPLCSISASLLPCAWENGVLSRTHATKS